VTTRGDLLRRPATFDPLSSWRRSAATLEPTPLTARLSVAVPAEARLLKIGSLSLPGPKAAKSPAAPTWKLT
jgi:hypothetical protein